jgi:hypothetical protein
MLLPSRNKLMLKYDIRPWRDNFGKTHLPTQGTAVLVGGGLLI